jgi:hypothetical protein
MAGRIDSRREVRIVTERQDGFLRRRIFALLKQTPSSAASVQQITQCAAAARCMETLALALSVPACDVKAVVSEIRNHSSSLCAALREPAFFALTEKPVNAMSLTDEIEDLPASGAGPALSALLNAGAPLLSSHILAMFLRHAVVWKDQYPDAYYHMLRSAASAGCSVNMPDLPPVGVKNDSIVFDVLQTGLLHLPPQPTPGTPVCAAWSTIYRAFVSHGVCHLDLLHALLSLGFHTISMEHASTYTSGIWGMLRSTGAFPPDISPLVRLLLDAGVSPEPVTGQSALSKACHMGCCASIRMILEIQPQVSCSQAHIESFLASKVCTEASVSTRVLTESCICLRGLFTRVHTYHAHTVTGGCEASVKQRFSDVVRCISSPQPTVLKAVIKEAPLREDVPPTTTDATVICAPAALVIDTWLRTNRPRAPLYAHPPPVGGSVRPPRPGHALPAPHPPAAPRHPPAQHARNIIGNGAGIVAAAPRPGRPQRGAGQFQPHMWLHMLYQYKLGRRLHLE